MALATIMPGTSPYPGGSYFDVFSFLGPLIMLVFLVLIIAGGFLLLRLIFGGGSTSQKVDMAKRGYYYLVSFITLSVVSFAASDSLNLILRMFSGESSYYSYDYFARSIALRIATLAVALPVYVYHWTQASKRTETVVEEARAYEARERKGYTQVVLVFSTIFLLIFGVRFVYLLLLYALGVSGTTLSAFAAPFSYTLGAAVVWVYHTKVLKGAGNF